MHYIHFFPGLMLCSEEGRGSHADYLKSLPTQGGRKKKGEEGKREKKKKKSAGAGGKEIPYEKIKV